jgi:hypothetical protein
MSRLDAHFRTAGQRAFGNRVAKRHRPNIHMLCRKMKWDCRLGRTKGLAATAAVPLGALR